ncbi:LytTR family DNA-binding domain-containing protein [Pediococcus acidilactici]|uniref:LytTR family DNA-binding domain-containing protein n=1 Tax=Pediococcus acidilactici TaxID=1254 RepID=A0AAW8YF00_PEDAC|nr:LytTR family DNA-binding domain-containing protein [Pediococcus acidilactici]GAC44726.1 two component transcriptional regulator [Pediococcus acidilactici NGRI 0510Q]KAF0368763.1 response regulator [Pediococcus acidilactici]KAF0517061.1 response regulator [Pediococcus acidilactici]KRN91716.1 two component transcriptional regulator [Pediococcus acidilactici]MCT3036289.1 DNA-binding response regulator [Pediococcus acidilactici]
MDILICEDNIEQLYNLEKIIKNYCSKKNLELNILATSTKAEDILPIIKNKEYASGALFILDICLDKSNVNGFEVAKAVRQRDRSSSIVFSTTHDEMTYLTFLYKVEALDYVLKDEPVTYQKRIEACIEAAYAKNQAFKNSKVHSERYLTFKIGPKLERILENEVLYAETSANKHRIIIHTVNKVLEIYGSLNNLLEESPKMVRCHNSFVINREKIQVLDLNQMQVLLSSGESCFVSRKYLSKLRQLLV